MKPSVPGQGGPLTKTANKAKTILGDTIVGIVDRSPYDEVSDEMRERAKKIKGENPDQYPEPVVPLPDEYELRRARRRRGQPFTGGYQSTVLTDRLGG